MRYWFFGPALVFYVSLEDKRLWFGDYAEHRRRETLTRLLGFAPAYPLGF